ncbi:hypothetical protein D2V07_17510 [Aurantiacibacter zhengii]|uniref:Uncharacterized protein n=1 Tax=Aurantiacibacter zhengii TaxID=2307003 RepID=A0A418NNG6_9SPHN|nr:hypothetical protein D2V07_17510 [Aurantiacibacter zhengii]
MLARPRAITKQRKFSRLILKLSTRPRVQGGDRFTALGATRRLRDFFAIGGKETSPLRISSCSMKPRCGLMQVIAHLLGNCSRKPIGTMVQLVQ